MTARRLNAIVDSKCSCASDADNVAIHSRQGNQELKCSIEITSSFRLVRTATGLAVSAQIDGECVDSSSRQLSRHLIPRFACSIALMKQQYARARFSRGKVSCLQDCTVRCLDIHNARRISPGIGDEEKRG